MKVLLFTFASRENELMAAIIIYLGQSRSLHQEHAFVPTFLLAASKNSSLVGSGEVAVRKRPGNLDFLELDFCGTFHPFLP
jgi:hypothetical protein